MCIFLSATRSCIPEILTSCCDPIMSFVGNIAGGIISPSMRSMIFTATAIASFVAGIFATYMSGMWMALPFFACSALSYLCSYLISQNEGSERRHEEIIQNCQTSTRQCEELRRTLVATQESESSLRVELQNHGREVEELRHSTEEATELSGPLRQQIVELTGQIDNLSSQRSSLSASLEETRALNQQICLERERIELLNASLRTRCEEAERTANLLRENLNCIENAEEILAFYTAQVDRLIARREQAQADLRQILSEIRNERMCCQQVAALAFNVDRFIQETPLRSNFV